MRSLYVTGCIYLFATDIGWEFVQFVQHGNFQWDQYLGDILGVCVWIYIQKLKLNTIGIHSSQEL